MPEKHDELAARRWFRQRLDEVLAPLDEEDTGCPDNPTGDA